MRLLKIGMVFAALIGALVALPVWVAIPIAAAPAFAVTVIGVGVWLFVGSFLRWRAAG